MRFALTFDYLCPFARIASETALMALDGGADHVVELRAFSLTQMHLEDGAAPVWEARDPGRGVRALEWGLAARDAFPDRFPAAHLAIYRARFDHSRNIDDHAVLRAAVEQAGLDPEAVERVVASGAPRRTLADDHTWAVEQHRVFGVPTWITDHRAVFTRLMVRPADPAEARRILERVLGLIEDWPQLNEFKQTKVPR
jgi:hypothetical protein